VKSEPTFLTDNLIRKEFIFTENMCLSKPNLLVSYNELQKVSDCQLKLSAYLIVKFSNDGSFKHSVANI
jgi:hypothetical protein